MIAGQGMHHPHPHHHHHHQPHSHHAYGQPMLASKPAPIAASTAAGALAAANSVIPSAGSSAAPANEDITTIFVVGFPMDMTEREFSNMFTFCPGFEAATLKVPTHEELMDATLSGSKKQIIGFARFRTRLQALEARDILSGRKVDPEGGSTLKAEMARKNMHVKRTLANELYHPAFHQYSALTLAAAAAAHTQVQAQAQASAPAAMQSATATPASIAAPQPTLAQPNGPALALPTRPAVATAVPAMPMSAQGTTNNSNSNNNNSNHHHHGAAPVGGALPALESLFAPSAATSPTREHHYNHQAERERASVRRFTTPPPPVVATTVHEPVAIDRPASTTLSMASSSVGVATRDTTSSPSPSPSSASSASASSASQASAGALDTHAQPQAQERPARRQLPFAINTTLANKWSGSRGAATAGLAGTSSDLLSPTTPVCHFVGAVHPAVVAANNAAAAKQAASAATAMTPSDSALSLASPQDARVLYIPRIPSTKADGTSIAAIGSFSGFVRAALEQGGGFGLWAEFGSAKDAGAAHEWALQAFGDDASAWTLVEAVPENGVVFMSDASSGGSAGAAAGHYGVERSMTL